MGRRVKCRYEPCGRFERYPETDMHIEMKGKEKKRPHYYHHDCWEKQKEEDARKEQDLKELDELYKTIKSLHKIEDVPKAFFVKLQELRNGNIKYEKKVLKKYKEGVPFHVMNKAYLIVKNKIKWARENKRFKNDFTELMYCFRIMESKINLAKKELERKKREEEMYINPEHSYSKYKVEPVKKFPKS